MRSRRFMIPVLILEVAFASGCGVLFSGRRQQVSVASTPGEARISFYRLDGEPVLVGADASSERVELPRPVRGLPYLAVVTADDHCPAYSVTTIQPTPGYFAETMLLAIPLIQLIGVGLMQVDERSGGCCSIAPVRVALEAGPCE